MKWIKNNWNELLAILFSVIVGVLLLKDPATYTVALIRGTGLLFAALGVFDLIKYFRAAPEEAAKGSSFYSGVTMVTAGAFCFFGFGWFVDAFPILAVLYGLFQVLLGFRKLQRMVDAIRMKRRLWYLRGIGAALTLVFGFVIVFHPDMKLVGVWAFTGVTLIVEGIFDCVTLIAQERRG